MKKIVLLLLFAGFLNGNSYAQAKQREVLLKQIAAFKVYIDYAQKGYSVAQKGLSAIGYFKRGEFNLHADYFNSLKKINPKIKSYTRVAEIVSLQVKVLKNYSRTIKQIRQNDLFHGDEIAYIKRVLGRLIENCDRTLEELILIVTEGKLEMKDDERIKRIDTLYQNMLESYTFFEDFSNQARLMSMSRGKEATDVKTSRALQGFNNNLP
ncbi:hypothetical protein ACM55K_12770 [Flavobacterium sp. LT1R49]|uniref:hypothetical protein n=1 Tax=Flavobacterium arabinosi TaxID=3398737 RepID=UPI003A8B670B